MALVVTVGGSTSDSYVTRQEADTYFRNHFSIVKSAAWATLSDPRQESALRRACQQIETIKFLDNEYGYGALPVALVIDEGWEVTVHKGQVDQRLQFPRNLDLDANGAFFIPQEVKDAQCEQAVYLLSLDETSLTTLQNGIVEEAVTAGDVKAYTRYAEGKQPTSMSPVAVELLRPYFRISSKVRRS